MAHYAFLDANNIVTEVIVGRNEDEVVNGISDWEAHYAEIRGQDCKRTSYNTYGGVHLTGGTPFRKNYAGIGFSYDPVKNAFIPPKPYASWTLNENSCLWEPPVPSPVGDVVWNEFTKEWVIINQSQPVIQE